MISTAFQKFLEFMLYGVSTTLILNLHYMSHFSHLRNRSPS